MISPSYLAYPSSDTIVPPCEPQLQEKKPPLSPLRNRERLIGLEQRFKERLFGQPEAIETVSTIIQRYVLNYYKNKPLCLLFTGSTGVGKTEMAKMMAEELQIPFHRFDMSEFKLEHSVARFLGSPPGYRGCENGGELVKKLKKDPICIILLDEFEKADPSIFPIFLQLFDEGHATDSMGNTASTTQAIFIITTNLGSKFIYDKSHKKLKEPLIDKLKPLFEKHFSTELCGRIDEMVVFNPMFKEYMMQVVKKVLGSMSDFMKEQKKIVFTWDDRAVEFLSSLHKDFKYGARGVILKIEKTIFALLVKTDIARTLEEGDSVHLTLKGNSLSLDVQKNELSSSPEAQLEPGILYYDFSGQRPENFIGKYAFRVKARPGGDRSFMDTPVLIKKILSNGHIVFDDDFDYALRMHQKDRSSQFDYDDPSWMLATPEIHAEAFFRNICADIKDEEIKCQAGRLVDILFKNKKYIHLSNETPFGILFSETRDDEEALQAAKDLFMLIGNIKVRKKKESSRNSVFSTPNYDFKLRAKL